jgi:hypothetical protein
VTDVPASVALPPPAAGDVQQFTIMTLPGSDAEEPSYRTVDAQLRSISEHAYFFVEAGADVPDAEVEDAGRVFEEEIWPAVTGGFGPPAIPGIDGDPRVVVMHTDLGDALGGYVSGEDAYPKVVAPLSNQREIVYMNLQLRPLGSDSYARILGHELQHVIHARADRDEDVWVNEGLSEVAATFVAGPTTQYTSYLDAPHTSLTGWDRENSGAHYGASALFFGYLLEQAGGRPEELATEQGDGIAGVERFLQAHGNPRSFEELFADWAVANYLDEPGGPYGYADRDVGPPLGIEVDPVDESGGELPQFGAEYLELDAAAVGTEPTFVLDGDREVPVVGAADGASGAFWWANRGDNIDTRLSRELDLSEVDSATLTFRTWFDIERWFDFGYVEVSTDGGETWTALAGQHTTTDDPLGAGYGPGYSGRSGGGDEPQWVDERIDLTPYAGQRVQLRFEYVTDDAISDAGWTIDDIAVPEIGFADDAEADAGGWHREGFVRVTEPLPQRFELRLIKRTAEPAVETIPLDAQNQAEVRIAGLGVDYDEAVIVVAPVTDGSSEPARYRYQVTSP